MAKISKFVETIDPYRRYFVGDDEVVNAKFFIENLGHYLISVAFYVFAAKIVGNGEYLLGCMLSLLAVASFSIAFMRTFHLIEKICPLSMLLNLASKDEDYIPNWKIVLICLIWIVITTGFATLVGCSITAGIRASFL